MSTEHAAYSLTSPAAVYANRALSHARWALGAVIFIIILNLISEDTPALTAVWGLWMLLEIPQVAVFGIRSVNAGRRDGHTLTFSVREGAFVSIPEVEAR